ncbi:MAG: hypothetical protein JZU59_17565 [Chromatium okenii]|nr:hypothetical protein [Chromatium okenii]
MKIPPSPPFSKGGEREKAPVKNEHKKPPFGKGGLGGFIQQAISDFQTARNRTVKIRGSQFIQPISCP